VAGREDSRGSHRSQRRSISACDLGQLLRGRRFVRADRGRAQGRVGRNVEHPQQLCSRELLRRQAGQHVSLRQHRPRPGAHGQWYSCRVLADHWEQGQEPHPKLGRVRRPAQRAPGGESVSYRRAGDGARLHMQHDGAVAHPGPGQRQGHLQCQNLEPQGVLSGSPLPALAAAVAGRHHLDDVRHVHRRQHSRPVR